MLIKDGIAEATMLLMHVQYVEIIYSWKFC
jgi:hypothetical protein